MTERRVKVAKCGYCKELKDYPVFKAPLGPPSYDDNPEARAKGLNVKDGYVMYSTFCYPCLMIFLDGLDEDYFRTGTIKEVKEEEVVLSPVKTELNLFQKIMRKLFGVTNE